jgi:hypothetical protein
MCDTPAPYASFLLRVWRSGAGGAWRASLEDTRTGERRAFAEVADAFAFLEAHYPNGAVPGERREDATPEV